ncbi:MAG: ABC-F family ATP-binding cassette domain-containing protein [Ruminococcus flavefaciens]|nr:ABC-F family ATP-binding cassette domain-containing protein [Ruminococcus flavefaciens]MCM1360929.1 ABC-F family ATP-binding cassette domain-containing protein [Clostridiales bacterium]MCM1435374.1 ABC-F family ATP-binding cassette domain-containing protein [Ruminococcus flavefaciens]
MLASLININKFYNGNQLLRNISLTIDETDKIGLVGNNGCGKSTLLKILTGSVEPDRFTEKDGIVSLASKTTIGYLEQMGGLNSESTVIDEMRSVFSAVYRAIDRLREIEVEIGMGDNSSADEYQQLSSWLEANDGYNVDVKIRMILNGMGFSEEELFRNISGFSGGEKTRLCISKLLLEEPNLLILDEPTNHLDFKTIMWLEDYLRSYKGAVLIVSHDRYFLDRLCTSICEIERGILTRYKGNYSAFVRQREENDARREKEYEIQQKQIAHMEEYVAKNLVRASTTKMAQSRRKQLEKMERIEKPTHDTKSAKIRFTYAVESPIDILKVKNADISVGEGPNRKTLVDDISFDVRRAEKIGIIGDNGIGKSTLLRIIQEQLPHKGIVRWNSNIKISYFEQEGTNLNRELSVMEELHSRYPSMSELEVRSLLAQVRLVGENVFKETGVISGGERAKLCFAIMMQEHGNVLILDEPTNHLDLSSKEAIEEALEEYTGTIIFVSHDRYLLSKIADRLIELTNGGFRLHNYGFEKYLDVLREEQAEQKRIADAEKFARNAEAAKEKSVKNYRSKQQRSADAARKNEMRRLEKEIDELQLKIDFLTEEIGKEEVYSDYELMNSKCLEIENLKQKIDENFELLIELDQ